MNNSHLASIEVPTDAVHTPVLIVGGGPIGLGMLLEMASRGIYSVLVEQSDGSIEHPRTPESTRTP